MFAHEAEAETNLPSVDQKLLHVCSEDHLVPSVCLRSDRPFTCSFIKDYCSLWLNVSGSVNRQGWLPLEVFSHRMRLLKKLNLKCFMFGIFCFMPN